MIVISGETLVNAANAGKYDKVVKLLSEGANIDYQDKVNNWTYY
jgi:hypothetical protein